MLDQGVLIHHFMETTTLDPLMETCDPAWSPLAGTFVDYPATEAPLFRIRRGGCFRLITIFGRTPPSTPCDSGPCNYRVRAQRGEMGDLGYSVASRPRVVGGPLVSENIRLTEATRLKGNDLRLKFESDTEISILSFEVAGIDHRGGRRVVGTIPCEQCTSGLSARYDVTLDHARLQGSKQIVVVARPSGRESNILGLR